MSFGEIWFTSFETKLRKPFLCGGTYYIANKTSLSLLAAVLAACDCMTADGWGCAVVPTLLN